MCLFRGKSIFLGIALSVITACSGYCLDWKALFESGARLSIEEASRQVEEEPRSLARLYVLGLTYLKDHLDTDAENVFKAMLEIEPGSAEGLWGLAEVLRRRHDYAQSIKILETIREQAPGFCPACITLGYIKYLQGEFEQSAVLTGEMLKREKYLDPENAVRAHVVYAGAKAMLALRGGTIAKLVHGASVYRHFKRAEKILPDSAVALVGLGGYYLLNPASQDRDKAGEYLRRAVENDPLLADAWVRLAQFYKYKGDLARYEQFLEKALEIDPINELALDVKSGTCLFLCVP